LILMMRHGVTVAGTSVRDCIFRSIYSARNAEYQVRAMMINSEIATLSPGEINLAGQISAKTTGLTRSWEYWSMRVSDNDQALAPVGKAPRLKAQPAPARAKPKRASKKRRR